MNNVINFMSSAGIEKSKNSSFRCNNRDNYNIFVLPIF